MSHIFRRNSPKRLGNHYERVSQNWSKGSGYAWRISKDPSFAHPRSKTSMAWYLERTLSIPRLTLPHKLASIFSWEKCWFFLDRPQSSLGVTSHAPRPITVGRDVRVKKWWFGCTFDLRNACHHNASMWVSLNHDLFADEVLGHFREWRVETRKKNRSSDSFLLMGNAQFHLAESKDNSLRIHRSQHHPVGLISLHGTAEFLDIWRENSNECFRYSGCNGQCKPKRYWMILQCLPSKRSISRSTV
jgi:hypothetical protein